MSMEDTTIPVNDPEKAQLLDAEGAPAPEVAPPQHEGRCSWSFRSWGLRGCGRPPWMTHHHCDLDGGHPHPSPHHQPRRRCPYRFVRILLRFFLIGFIFHMAFRAFQYGRHRWSPHHDHRHGYHHSDYDQFDDDNDVFSEEWRDDYLFSEAYNLDFPIDDSLLQNPHRPAACNPEDLVPWDGPSEFSFSPSDFSTLVVRQRGNSDHGKIYLHESKFVDEVVISVSILIADEKLTSGIRVAAHENVDKGIYALDVRTVPHRIGQECVKLVIDVTFPSQLDPFKAFIKGANVDIIAKPVSEINFETIVLETFNGTISFKDIWANQAHIYALYGFVKGSIDVVEKLQVAVFVGKIDITARPDEIPVEIVAKVGHGSAHVKVPGESYSGSFKVVAYAGQVGVEASNADLLVVKKSGPNFAVGYFNEEVPSKIFIAGGAHSVANLTFV